MKNQISLILLSVLVCAPLLSQEPHAVKVITIEQALESGLNRVEFLEMQAASMDSAQQQVPQQGAWDNPDLIFSTEQINQQGMDSRESFLMLSQRVELFGQAGLRAQAAGQRKLSVGYQNEMQQVELRALIQLRFYEALYYKQRAGALLEWEGRIQTLLEQMVEREKAGEVAGYDLRRLGLVLSEARARSRGEGALYAGVWEQLASLVGLEQGGDIAGNLLPVVAEQGKPVSSIPRFQAMDAELQAASFTRQAASHWRLSELSLQAGIKNTEIAGEKDYGIFFSVQVPLPFSKGNRSRYLAARARVQLLQNQKNWEQIRTQGQIEGLRQQIALQGAALEQYRKESLEGAQDLPAIAQSAYEAGEIGILALLDAFQSYRDAALNVLAMESDIRNLAIELERLGGGQ